MLQGHRGWVYCLLYHDKKLYSGGDDFSVRIWDLDSCLQLEVLEGTHINGVTSIAMTNGMLFTASFDQYIVAWDYDALQLRM